MNTRRKFLTIAAGAATIPLIGCNGNAVSVGEIVLWLQTNCGFTTTLQSITAVIAAMVSGFNPAAGAAAVVAADVATQIENAICDQVKAKVAQNPQLKSAVKGHAESVTVKVHGVDVSGTYTAK